MYLTCLKVGAGRENWKYNVKGWVKVGVRRGKGELEIQCKRMGKGGGEEGEGRIGNTM